MGPNEERPLTLLREGEAARRLAVTPACLRKWRSNGRGPKFLRLESRAIRYSDAELQRWIEERALQTVGVR